MYPLFLYFFIEVQYIEKPMNFCSLEEAFGTDPYENSRSAAVDKRAACEESQDCSSFDVDSLGSYNAFHSPYVIPEDSDFMKFQGKGCNTPATVPEPPKLQPVPATNKCPTPQMVHAMQRGNITSREITNAVTYIVSGVYIIFILDMFVRMGSKLC
jgi:hypothetical protein